MKKTAFHQQQVATEKRLLITSGMSQRQRYCGCGGSDRNIPTECPSCSMMWPTRAHKLNGYLLGSYRIATTPEPNSSRLTSLKSRCFDSPANSVGP
jgi:hypothetical protein